MQRSEVEKAKNMFVRTHLAASSGNQSTDMHSRPGKSTINTFHQFRNIDRQLPVKETREQMLHKKLM
jgi:hypothetical protein